MDNCDFYEMRVPQGSQDLPHMKDQIRMAKDGYVYAPTKPGLGYDIAWDKLDDLTVQKEKQPDYSGGGHCPGL